MTHDEISKFLQGCHIGCLPMPSDYEMWKISSPLKLSEYLSSGLLVVGIDHTGNRFDEDLKSIHLQPKENLSKVLPSGLNQYSMMEVFLNYPNYQENSQRKS